MLGRYFALSPTSAIQVRAIVDLGGREGYSYLTFKLQLKNK